MAKFKKLALLCTALLASASMAVATGCDFSAILGGNSASSEVESSVGEESTPDEDESTPDEDESTPDEDESTPDEDESTPDEDESTPDEDESSSDEGDLDEAPAFDTEISIADATAIGSAMEHDTYTEGKYYVTGTITEVKNATYGNFTIEDADGNSILVYGSYSADGSTRYDALEVKPNEGDIVTVYGIVGQYNGTAQLKNAWITAFENVSPDVELVIPEADSELTIAEAVALGEALKADSEFKYYVSGTIESIAQDYYGNMTIVDANGDSIYVYGTYSADGSTRYGDMAQAPQVGDTVKLYGIVSYYNVPQLKNAWIVESTSYVEDEVAYYEELIGNGSASLTSESDWSDVWGTVTVNVPEAGTYAIYANTDVKFGPAGATDSWNECSTSYTFTATEAGEVTLSTNYYAYSAGETVEFNYYFYKLNNLVITEESGTAQLAANVQAPITVVAPAAGTYYLISAKSVHWYSAAIVGEADAYGSLYTITATEAGQEITVYALYNDLEWVDFEFAWTFVAQPSYTVGLGDNNATLYAGAQIPFSFTAEASNTYTVTVNSAYNTIVGVYTYVDEYGGYYTWSEGDYTNEFIFDLAAGETKNFHVYYNGYTVDYDNGPSAIDVVVNVAAFVEADPSALVEGENKFTAPVDGVAATFVAPAAGWYRFEEISSYSNVIFVDGAEYGESLYEVMLAEGEAFNFVVKGEGALVTLEISSFVPTVTLSEGVNTIYVAGPEGTLDFDIDYYAPYTMTIDNANVVVYINGEAYVNGTLFQATYMDTFTIATLDGAPASDVVITLVAFEYPSLNDGDNTVDVAANGSTYKYTVATPGTYTFTISGGITFATADASDSYDYPSSLSADGTITINAKAGAEIELTMQADADITVSVAVACISTVNSFEASVTMDDNFMPVSLTIASLKDQECVYFAATRMVGDYVLSWSEDYGNIIVYAGENVGMMYSDCQVVLSRTMEDGIVYVVVRNNSGADLENVVFNIALYEAPSADIQGELVEADVETTIEIDAWQSTTFTFIAPETGSYTLSTASSIMVDLWIFNENWGEWDRAWETMIDSANGGEYTFELEAGEAISFWAMEYDMGAVSFVFTISSNNSVVPELPATLVVGENSVYVTVNNYFCAGTEISFTAPEAGTYVISAAEGEENADLGIIDEYGIEWIALSYEMTLEEGDVVNFLVCTSAIMTLTEDYIDLVITKVEAPATPVVQFSADIPSYVEIAEGGSAILEGYVVGKYTVAWDESIENLVVYFGMQPVANGDIIEAASPRIPTQLTLTTSDGAALSTRVLVATYVEPPVALVVGDNAVEVTDAWAGRTASFTASADGVYSINAAEDETNAILLVEDEYGAEMLSLPYSIKLAAGESFNFIVATANYEVDTIDLVVAKEIETLSLAAANALGLTYASNAYTSNKYYVVGTIYDIYNTQYGNCYIVDENGDTLLVYGLYSADGATRYDAMSNKPVVGDTVKLLSVVGNYNGTAQLKSAWVIESNSDSAPAYAKALIEKNDLVIDTKFMGSAEITLPVAATYADVTITWSADSDAAVIANGVLTVANVTENLIFTATATITCGDVALTREFTVTVEAPVAGETKNYVNLDSLSLSSSYATSVKTADGWTIKNAQVHTGAASGVNTSTGFNAFYGTDTSVRGVCLNGKKSAIGSITSPTLNNGITKLSFNYGFAFSESKGVSLHIKVTGADGTVVETDFKNSSVSQKTIYEYEWVLPTAISGDFTIEITNNCPSASTSNKDRTELWNLAWVSNI